MIDTHVTGSLSIRKNMLWNSIGCFFYQTCMWLITVLVVLISGYTDSGILAYAIALGNMYFALAVYNMRTYQVSDINRENEQCNYVAFRLITMSGAAFIMLFYLFLTTQSLPLLLATLCMLLFKADEALSNVYYGVVQHYGRMDFIGKSQIIRGLIIVITFTGVLFLTQNLAIAILVMAVLCICVTLFYDRRKAALTDIVHPSISKKKTIYLLRTCAPAAITLLFFGTTVAITRQIYEIEFGEDLLGIYAAIATPTVFVQVLSSYLYSPLLVSIAKAWLEHNTQQLISILGKVLIAIVLIVFVLCIAAVLWGTDLLVLIYGRSIAEHAGVLIPTIVAVGCAACMTLFIDVMIAFRKLFIALISNAFALVIAFFSSLPLIYAYGMNGINIAIICAFLCGIIVGTVLFLVSIFYRQDKKNAWFA